MANPEGTETITITDLYAYGEWILCDHDKINQSRQSAAIVWCDACGLTFLNISLIGGGAPGRALLAPGVVQP